MPSPIKRLSDADREHVNHMIRRDAHTDMEIAAEIETRLGEPISTSDKGRCAAIRRWRDGKVYNDWLKRYRADRSELEKALSEQRHRYEMLSDLLKNTDGSGFEGVSKALQARLLQIAAESSDADLIENFSASGWVKNLIGAIQREQRLDLQKALAEKANEAADIAGNSDLSAEERARRCREIFGR